MTELFFKGDVFNGSLDMEPTEMVCVPTKPHYAGVDLCLRANIDKGPNVVVADIDNNCLSFEEKKKLGFEIEKRWNNGSDTAINKTIHKEVLKLASIMGREFGDSVERFLIHYASDINNKSNS